LNKNGNPVNNGNNGTNNNGIHKGNHNGYNGSNGNNNGDMNHHMITGNGNHRRGGLNHSSRVGYLTDPSSGQSVAPQFGSGKSLSLYLSISLSTLYF
jgi:hypothetical protein